MAVKCGQAADNGTYGYGLIRLDRAIAGPTTLAAGSVINVAPQQMTYWSQPLTTGGAFNKTGSGYLIVAGRTTAAGDVSVRDGAFSFSRTTAARCPGGLADADHPRLRSR